MALLEGLRSPLQMISDFFHMQLENGQGEKESQQLSLGAHSASVWEHKPLQLKLKRRHGKVKKNPTSQNINSYNVEN